MTRFVSGSARALETNSATSSRWLMYGAAAAPFRRCPACFWAGEVCRFHTAWSGRTLPLIPGDFGSSI
jgi:hypothetical protein